MADGALERGRRMEGGRGRRSATRSTGDAIWGRRTIAVAAAAVAGMSGVRLLLLGLCHGRSRCGVDSVAGAVRNARRSVAR